MIGVMTGEEVRADPIALAHLADCLLQASQRIADEYRGLQDALAIPAGAFGDSAVGPRMSDAHLTMVTDAGLALARLVGVLELDTDRLYGVASVYQQADQDAATPMTASRT
jgi:hypothetical protein